MKRSYGWIVFCLILLTVTAGLVIYNILGKENNAPGDQPGVDGNNGPNMIEGIVDDATMNTVKLKTSEGKAYLFSTVDINKSNIGGIMIGDTLRIYYTGDLEVNARSQNLVIIKVEKLSSAQDPAPDPNQGQQGEVPAAWQDNGIFAPFYEAAYRKLSGLSLEEKVGQMILARCPKDSQITSIQNYHLGGYVLFQRDFQDKTAEAVISAISSYQNSAAIPMLMAVDEEGGAIVRISSNPRLADAPFQSPQEVYAKGGLEGIRADAVKKAGLLKELGLNVNLAPVADVSQNPADYMYERALGKAPEETGTYVAAAVKALQDSGIGATLKHFPGYGNNVDTHTGISIDQRPYSTFEKQDFIPFQAGIAAGAESILVSHNVVECMEKGVPASLSAPVHRTLRDTLKFTGVVITDDLSMNAIKEYTQNADPAVKAVLAGNDLLIMTQFEDGYNAILSAVKSGEIQEEQVDRAVWRILAWKYEMGLLK